MDYEVSLQSPQGCDLGEGERADSTNLYQHLWARGYFAVSVGNVTAEMVKEYIEHHFEGKEGADSFRLEEP